VFGKKTNLITKNKALPGRVDAIKINEKHFVNGNYLFGNIPENLEKCVVGMGCFWGAERLFWNLRGVFSTSVGYCGGYTKNPTYEEVCSGKTGHVEVVQIIFDPLVITYDSLIKIFFENHDPTEYMRQGNDVGTQYRSAIFTFSKMQESIANNIKIDFEEKLIKNGFSNIKTEITMIDEYYFAEEYHQQYLAKNINGYCGLKGTGFYCT